MNNGLNKKLSDIFGKVDEKVMQARINSTIDMLKKGNTDELAKKINKIDKDELMEKINELDTSKLQDMKIDTNAIKNNISNDDLNKLKELVGDRGDEIVSKLKELFQK